MQDGSLAGIGGPQITADAINAQYTVETVVMAVLAAAIFALLVGFITGVSLIIQKFCFTQS
jgi:ABC-type methionine transport system permease subunit